MCLPSRRPTGLVTTQRYRPGHPPGRRCLFGGLIGLLLSLFALAAWPCRGQNSDAPIVTAPTPKPELPATSAAPSAPAVTLPPLDPAPDKISFATTCVSYRLGLEEVIRRYEKLHPNRKIELNVLASGYETWIRTRFAAGRDMIPDIYHSNYTFGYDRQGRLISFSPYLNVINPYTGQPWRDVLDMPLMNRYKVQGNIYTIHLDTIEIGLFYNKDIFRQLGLAEPQTWDELMAACEKIKQAGLIPIATGGDLDSFWIGQVGWLVRILTDAYLRNDLPLIMTQPGDWDYDASRNAGYDPASPDPYNNNMVDISLERKYNAIRDGRIDFRSERLHAVYQRLRQIAQYWQPGAMGNNMGSAMQLFFKKKAAMCIMSSGNVSSILRDFKKLEPADRFPYGVMWLPPITNDPRVCGPFHGVGGAGAVFAVTQKRDPVHERNVMDFMMYLFAPESAQRLFDMTLAEELPINGPPAIKGVKLPPAMEPLFMPFRNRGYEKITFLGLDDEQESVYEWATLAQEYVGGRLPLDDFLNEYQKIMLTAIPKLKKRFGYDLDPATKDEPPVIVPRKRTWNPFENGSLMLGIILTGFGGFGAWHVRQARGAARRRTLVAYTLLAPTFLLLGLFCYFPALSGLYHAFTKWEEGQSAVFNGLENFRRVAADRVLWQGALNLAILLAAGLAKAIVVPFLAAEMILTLASPRLRYLFRTAFLLPMVVPGMVGLLIWSFIYDPSTGLLNQALSALGLIHHPISWLGEPHRALPSLIFMGFPWIGAFGLLIYMAGLMAIPSSVHEAYQLESQSLWRRIFALDVPLVRGQTRLLVILTFIGALQDFQTMLILTSGGPGLATMVPALRMYHEAFRFSNFGYGAAIGFVLFLVILLITIVNLKVLKNAEEEI